MGYQYTVHRQNKMDKQEYPTIDHLNTQQLVVVLSVVKYLYNITVPTKANISVKSVGRISQCKRYNATNLYLQKKRV